MMPSRLIEIDGQYHFLTERYDRQHGQKYHTQTLAAMMPEATSYEDLMDVCMRLHLPYSEREQTYRRAVFNILTTNVDAHIKNFSFMMGNGGDWHITPAYDLTFSCFNPGNRFDPSHYLSMNGKTMNISKEDMIVFGRIHDIRNPQGIINECVEAVMQFRAIAENYGIASEWINRVERHFEEMTPDLLSGLEGYKPHVFSYILQPSGIHVENAQWTQMDNGAFRLTALLNGEEYRITVGPKSDLGKRIAKQGGEKMPEERQRQFVEQLLLPRYHH